MRASAGAQGGCRFIFGMLPTNQFWYAVFVFFSSPAYRWTSVVLFVLRSSAFVVLAQNLALPLLLLASELSLDRTRSQIGFTSVFSFIFISSTLRLRVLVELFFDPSLLFSLFESQ